MQHNDLTPQTNIYDIHDIPDEVILLIINYLDFYDLILTIALVSRHWAGLAENSIEYKKSELIDKVHEESLMISTEILSHHPEQILSKESLYDINLFLCQRAYKIKLRQIKSLDELKIDELKKQQPLGAPCWIEIKNQTGDKTYMLWGRKDQWRLTNFDQSPFLDSMQGKNAVLIKYNGEILKKLSKGHNFPLADLEEIVLQAAAHHYLPRLWARINKNDDEKTIKKKKLFNQILQGELNRFLIEREEEYDLKLKSIKHPKSHDSRKLGKEPYLIKMTDDAGKVSYKLWGYKNGEWLFSDIDPDPNVFKFNWDDIPTDEVYKIRIRPGSAIFNALKIAHMTKKTLVLQNLQWADFSDTSIASLDLSRANLLGANFAGSSIVNCKFIDANLSKTNFTGTTIQFGLFDNVNANKANFTGAAFHSVDLTTVELTNANLKNASFSNCILTMNHLSKAKNLQGIKLYNKNPTNQQDYLNQINFENCNFTELNLTNAVMCGINFSAADFSDSTLNGIKFIQCNLNKVNFHRASLVDADLSGTLIISANFNEANLDRANLKNCRFTGTDFSRSNLKGADLSNVTLGVGCTFTEADLTDVNLAGANFIMLEKGGITAEQLCKASTIMDIAITTTDFNPADLIKIQTKLVNDYKHWIDQNNSIEVILNKLNNIVSNKNHLLKHPNEVNYAEVLNYGRNKLLAMIKSLDGLVTDECRKKLQALFTIDINKKQGFFSKHKKTSIQDLENALSINDSKNKSASEQLSLGITNAADVSLVETGSTMTTATTTTATTTTATTTATPTTSSKLLEDNTAAVGVATTTTNTNTTNEKGLKINIQFYNKESNKILSNFSQCCITNAKKDVFEHFIKYLNTNSNNLNFADRSALLLAWAKDYKDSHNDQNPFEILNKQRRTGILSIFNSDTTNSMYLMYDFLQTNPMNSELKQLMGVEDNKPSEMYKYHWTR